MAGLAVGGEVSDLHEVIVVVVGELLVAEAELHGFVLSVLVEVVLLDCAALVVAHVAAAVDALAVGHAHAAEGGVLFLQEVAVLVVGEDVLGDAALALDVRVVEGALEELGLGVERHFGAELVVELEGAGLEVAVVVLVVEHAAALVLDLHVVHAVGAFGIDEFHVDEAVLGLGVVVADELALGIDVGDAAQLVLAVLEAVRALAVAHLARAEAADALGHAVDFHVVAVVLDLRVEIFPGEEAREQHEHRGGDASVEQGLGDGFGIDGLLHGGCHLLAVGVAVVGVLGRGLVHYLLYLVAHVGVEVGHAGQGLAGHGALDFLEGEARGVVGRAAREHGVDEHADGVEVRTVVYLAPIDLLGTHVGGGAHVHLLVDGVGLRHDLRDTEVHHLHVAVVLDHDVRGLDVAVDNALGVGVGEGVEDFADDGVGLFLHDEAVLLRDEVFERDALDVFHDEVDPVGAFHVVEELHDARVVELAERDGLLLEEGAQGGAAGHLGAEHLDGHLLVDAGVHGQVDRTHAARA